jgi:myo-inositol-hexaphosphate 3-phosphohydrolase
VWDHSFAVPARHNEQDLYQENDDDPLKDWSPQFEGSVIDRTTGMLYAGEEDVGIWQVPVTGGEPRLVYETRGASSSTFNNPQSVISRDLEGLTIYYGGDGTKYLLVSSQGGAHGDAPAPDAPYDDSFAVFDLNDDIKLLGAFRVAAKGDMDAVQESDGADVISLSLPGFENGLFITQDGYAKDLDALDGEVASTNFKYVDWSAIANAFTPPLKIAATGYDPRR